MPDNRGAAQEIDAVLKKHGPEAVLNAVAKHIETIDADRFGHLAEGIEIIAKDVGEQIRKS